VRIVLLRHGEPSIDKDLRLSARDFGNWVSCYNAAGIDGNCLPSRAAIEQAARCQFVVCSNLPRSLESAKALGVKDNGPGEDMFREMEMPYASWSFPRLSLVTWCVLFRLMWVIGYRANAESFADARKRARACAERLTELASTHRNVLHVGHGTMNWFIAKHLKSMGWTGSKAPRKYWEFGVYSYPTI
jgi:broad specificity phosphatase PhoE